MTNCKEFNEKLIERYGDDFKNYVPPEKVSKTAADIRAERIQKYNQDDDAEEFNGKKNKLEAHDARESCGSCGRSFSRDRIVKHEEVCYNSKANESKTQEEQKSLNAEAKPSSSQDEDTNEFSASEVSEIAALEAQLKQLKMLKAQKEAAAIGK